MDDCLSKVNDVYSSTLIVRNSSVRTPTLRLDVLLRSPVFTIESPEE